MSYRFDVDLTADQKVAAFVIADYRDRNRGSHLGTCPDAIVSHVEGNDGLYGCDTGCEYARLEADISCPHGESVKAWTYGQFGELADILEDIGTTHP